MWCFLSFFPLIFGIDDVAVGLIVGGLITALADIGMGLYNNSENKKENSINRNWQEDMMDKQNAYNTPQEQMKRLQEAGINPATIGMASGTVQGGNLSAGVGSSPTLPVSNLGSISGSLSQIMNAFKSGNEGLSDKTFREQRLDNLEAQTEQLRASAESLGVSAAGQEIVNRYIEAEKEFGLKNFQADLDLKYQQIATLRSTEKREYATIENVFPAEVKKYLSEANVNYWNAKQVVANIDKIRAETELTSAKIESEGLTSEQIQAQTGLIKEQTDLTSQEADYYSKVTDKYLEQLDASIKQLAASAGLSEEQAYWYLFELMSKNTFKVGPVTVNPTYMNWKGSHKVDKEYNQRYGTGR